MRALRTDIAVIGGSLGGVAAALAASRLGRRVVLATDTRWIGGQLTSQLVPPDEHPWIESFGASASYRALRARVREFYRSNLPLSDEARDRRALNPGNGWVSAVAHDPRVALAVLREVLLPYQMSGRLVVLTRHELEKVVVDGDFVSAVLLRDAESDATRVIEAGFFIDATPCGDLLALGGVEHVAGAEARSETGEPHALLQADARAHQAVTVCFAVEHLPGEDHTIERPDEYAFWRDHRPAGWPGKLLDWTVVDPPSGAPVRRGLFDAHDGHDLWSYRRILDANNFAAGFARGDVTIVNWPQNDYWESPVIDVDAAERARGFASARALSRSLLYWLQTEAPRRDGREGYPGLRLRGDVAGETEDGMAEQPYVRESRRIRAEFTVREDHIAHPLRPDGPQLFRDSVGIGCYRIDLHPRVGGHGYVDLGAWPFQIPLGALVPIRVENVLPGAKNLGVTHVANGAFRVHPVEWSVGEASGLLAAYCHARFHRPRAIRARAGLLDEFQTLLGDQGIPLVWPRLDPL